MSDLLATLRRRGWVIRQRTGHVDLLPDDLRSRYPTVPVAVVEFLEGLEVCNSAAEDVWFLTPEEFRKTEVEGFRWNEFERMSLEGCAGDAAAEAVVRTFWDAHLPIMMAVHSDYDYLAVRLGWPGRGAIVHGSVPEWESTSEVAPSFDVFLRRFAEAAESRRAEYPYNVFLG